MAKVALLIGISEYELGLAPLPNAVKDVEAMRRVLVNPEMGDFAEADVTMLKNPQRQEMEDAIYNLYAHRQKDDLLLLYFSGHGVRVESGDFYLSTSITRKNQGKLIPTSAVAATNVHSWMNQSNSRRLVVILDCCFSGAFAKGWTPKDTGIIDLQQHLGGEGRAILTASTSTQYAFESDGLELSIYTHYLVEGIEKGAADIDGDGLIAVDELHRYAKSKVQEASPAMTPEFYPFKDGYRIFLAKSPKDDPSLKYRKEFDKIAHEDEGEISRVTRIYLNKLRNSLRLSADEADAIEFEVLEPYRQHQQKLQDYKQALSQIKQYPLSNKDRNGLKRLQNILNLRDEDIQPIEQRVLDPKQVEYERQQQAEKLRLEQETAEYQRQQAELQEQRERELSLPNIQTQAFEFDIATLTRKSAGFLGMGKKTYEINRSRGRAEFFTENLGNNVVMDMVAIPSGKFLMGSPDNESGRSDSESPQHPVTIQPFFMGKFPVTQSQWKAIATLPKVNIDLNPEPSNFKGANRPVEQVSWDNAIEFCARLSKKTGKTYRLPTEAEWEYACRAGTTTPFYFGETISTDLANYNGNYAYSFGLKGEYREQTTEVGNFPANPFGLLDMHGTLWEWCQDEWHKNYEGATSDGSVWITENNNYIRVLRGGSWFSSVWKCRSGARDRNARDSMSYYVGFRVVEGRVRFVELT
ncbi:MULTISPECIES: caspase, EACC1-associated type [unclassified Nostoc]|uniref:caspase, EACC1-associated type n=1 Tax=unclassified Nostoc TaxID=2593658 RepID=UPI002AD24C0B|nr:SUMF1/EgtB/PvdO family nonheme iron enzyme [Nostoc sp. DedQUE03]MDZ7974355.1 SUMF1/EgtB/PvdO family nonheme iron enzyme [Nostoc sp. DedQUE03]MDZ8045137.1 SUMF1/EgtB/PvdO family nonheme iron enzyme [Nostoc sp. DedQUE02]